MSLRAWLPKSIETLREGYDSAKFTKDVLAGLTVAIVALPLSMALAIASGATPDKGLITAVVAGFLISALGGTRFQIGGPTGAFVVVVFNVIAQHGYDGLLQATVMAGAILIVAALARFGAVIRYMPQPVVTGFTSGIALIIFSSQVKDFFGLAVPKPPADFIPKWVAYAENAATLDPATFAVGAGSLVLILLARRYSPRLPGFLLAVVAGSAAVAACHLHIETIGSRFGDLPNTLPVPALPHMEWGRVRELFPSAFTIAFLAGIESLLSAVVADSLAGTRHRSNGELLAQGIANCASALFGGLPATGAIARTATNIRSGAYSPVAGMLHAIFLFAFMYFFAPLARYIPLASLAAVLIVVAWNMSEIERFRHLLRGPRGDGLVLLSTFLLTALVDLTVAIEVGIVLACLLFMHRMTQAVEIQSGRHAADAAALRRDLPKDVESVHFDGPFFFGVVSHLTDVLEQIDGSPRAYILDMEDVPMMDASGASALAGFVAHCRKHNAQVLIAGLRGQPRELARRMGVSDGHDHVRLFATYAEAVAAVKA
ncbi:MAG: SulP family inorganic anion transporter [Alphaproteobacteria bacterium]|nr:SulP family inorganic anion transporter [Alphaproteobacteria bacterium]